MCDSKWMGFSDNFGYQIMASFPSPDTQPDIIPPTPIPLADASFSITDFHSWLSQEERKWWNDFYENQYDDGMYLQVMQPFWHLESAEVVPDAVMLPEPMGSIVVQNHPPILQANQLNEDEIFMLIEDSKIVFGKFSPQGKPKTIHFEILTLNANRSLSASTKFSKCRPLDIKLRNIRLTKKNLINKRDYEKCMTILVEAQMAAPQKQPEPPKKIARGAERTRGGKRK